MITLPACHRGTWAECTLPGPDVISTSPKKLTGGTELESEREQVAHLTLRCQNNLPNLLGLLGAAPASWTRGFPGSCVPSPGMLPPAWHLCPLPLANRKREKKRTCRDTLKHHPIQASHQPGGYFPHLNDEENATQRDGITPPKPPAGH